ncbi:PTS transporter subunit EIIB [Actinomyces vulturis]|uniref:PTS transporter subunit EIIB n=1 Tax=Actinomyces vulturis TaxID=1857645 RepID=UPI000831C438|nr:PTS transporter subunit EIIB [Actinomyces vulturis]
MNADLILEGLGGWDNIALLESCVTRLRVEVVNPAFVVESRLREAGAYGVVRSDNVVQVVVGLCARDLTAQLAAYHNQFRTS